MIIKTLIRAAPVALLLLAAVTAPTQAAQAVGTYAEVVCSATTADSEAWSHWVGIPNPPGTAYSNADAGGSAVGGGTSYYYGLAYPFGSHILAHFQGTYVQATWAAASAKNNVGSVNANCEFDPFNVIEPKGIDSDGLIETLGLGASAVGCKALLGGADRAIDAAVGVDEAGLLWAVSDAYTGPLVGSLTADAASVAAPTLTMTDAVFEAVFGPEGCSVRLA